MKIRTRISDFVINNTVLKCAEYKNKNNFNINNNNEILIFSNPRGGSTWLAELLSEIPDSILCTEPLFKGKLKEFNDLNFYWHQPIPPGTEWAEAKNVFKKLLNGEILRLSIYRKNKIKDIYSTKKIIFKFCYGNMLLEWITENFNLTPILLVRHPCAVVSSQLLHKSWNALKTEKISYDIEEFPFNDTYRLYEDILKTVGTVEQHMAATWCLTMSNSLKSKFNDVKWITVSYENLYSNYEDEIERIFNRMNIPIPDSIYTKQKKMSATTIKSSEEFIKSGSQLSSWKSNLTINQQENIMSIVKEFGIEHYDLNTEPNLDLMYVKN